MAKATLSLSNGTSVVIEGTPEEVHHLLTLYGGDSQQPAETSRRNTHKRAVKKKTTRTETPANDRANLSDIVNLIKTCDEAEIIEEQVLDRTSQVNRILLPLYVVHEYLDNGFGLTSGDVSKITTDLGIPVSVSNASTTLSGTALRYVVGDSVRKRGRPVRYKLHRRGVQYIKSVLSGAENEN